MTMMFAAAIGLRLAGAVMLASPYGGGPPAAPQSPPRTFIVVVTGVGGDPKFADQFYQLGASMTDAATKRLGVPDSLVTFLTETPARDPSHRARASTKDEIERTLVALSPRMQAGDQLFVLLIGHGSGQGADSRFNTPGPDPSAADFARMLAGFASHPVFFIDASSASGDFMPVLAAPNRVVITATKSAVERNESIFARYFVAAFAADGADADKDGRVSLLEAFDYARTEVARAYESDNKLQSEHAMLDDDGDGVGSAQPGAKAKDGARARVAFVGAPRVVAASLSGDPRLNALYAERQTIEAKIDALKSRKAETDSVAYARAMETLLVDLATKSREIRQREGAKP
ncbi:MAG: hypothetical protein ABJD07_02490 [Gemmatimonadaceae bacterium]